MSERSRTAKIPCASMPLYVAVDPLLALLAEKNITQPIEAWRIQALSGPTLPAKVQAIRALAAAKDESALGLALQYAGDRRAAVSLRTEAMSIVSACADVNELVKIAAASDAWQVRLAAVNAIKDRIASGTSAANVSASLLSIARDDASSKVRAAAIRALPLVNLPEGARLIDLALDAESQDDGIRQAAIDALVTISGRDALVKAVKYTGEAYLPRTRAMAAGAAVKLAAADRDLAYQALVSMLGSNELRTRMGAGQALVDLGDKRAMSEFDSMIAKTPTKDVSWMVGAWKKALEAK